ncbi:YigZ family protein [Desulfopila sp. IMCC35008]|uniref:YigZ family protein n=1 Tax=Desulfopila sp. IMCC35008 TaxID=2653858 RepID=UPI0013D2C1D2|nr:YigZ family protein [Desulfopila sp. IMCC35008]
MADYRIPTGNITFEQYVKRSHFICHLTHTISREEAMSFIHSISAHHPTANHNCWAFIAGPPDDASGWGMNDDGEPKGCAGKPMFNVLNHCGAGEICAVVTRYFGGIKLGTGGMARAYSSTVQLALEKMEFTTKVHCISIELLFPYNLQKNVEHFVQLYAGTIVHTEYAAKVRMVANIPVQHLSTLEARLLEIGQGDNLLVQVSNINDKSTSF